MNMHIDKTKLKITLQNDPCITIPQDEFLQEIFEYFGYWQFHVIHLYVVGNSQISALILNCFDSKTLGFCRYVILTSIQILM